jgi:hypothetical protein
MTDVQLLTITLTLLAILGSVWANHKSVEDMRDVLRAELKAQAAEFGLALKTQSGENNTVLQRIENKIDHFADTIATHSGRLDKLEGK